MLCCGAALATLREELRDAELVTLAPGALYAQETSLARPCAEARTSCHCLRPHKITRHSRTACNCCSACAN